MIVLVYWECLDLAINFPSIGILWICDTAPVAVGLALGPPVIARMMERFYSWVVLDYSGWDGLHWSWRAK